MTLVTSEIDFEQVEEWVKAYKKNEKLEIKKQLLTLIIISCKPFVDKIAYGLARRSTDPVEDIIQVGNIGLIKGIRNWKLGYGNLKSYLKLNIIGEIKHYLRDKVQAIKPPRAIIELSYRINKINLENIENAGIECSKEQLSKKLNVSQNEINEVIDFERRKIISLEQIQFLDDDEDSKTYSEVIADEKTQNEQDIIENKIILSAAIKKLPKNLQVIINEIYYNNLSQKEIAQKLKTPQSNVSRLQKRALRMLFDIIKNNDGEK